jgi:hypothetical protein
MAPSFRNRGALSGYIALEVKNFFCAAAQKVEIGWGWLLTSLRGGQSGSPKLNGDFGPRGAPGAWCRRKDGTNLISLHD